ncbi:hypothetical protein PQX77_001974 [Marasmius sp. AFHP31]|nr:hypothetical protein PQX77_001974 [Marasmius sp. AFHP31]
MAYEDANVALNRCQTRFAHHVEGHLSKKSIEDPTNDPREFHRGDIGDLGDDMPPGMDPFLVLLQGLMNRPQTEGGQRNQRPSSPFQRETSPSSSFSFHFSSGGPGTGARTISIGGPRTLGGERPGPGGGIPTMSEYLGRGPERGNDEGPGAGIAGPLMAQYLMAMLGHRGPFPDLPGGDPAARGRMGDYVFNQEALDQIITQLMENSNSSRPVPATEDVIGNLPREVLTEDSSMLEKDCAVCKEQFKLGTEDPDEQVIVTLPCKHPFHEPCILPWLKSSGTCPVCRHQLVPQPGHSSPPQSPGGSSGSPRPRSPGNRDSNNNNSHGGAGFFQNLFGSMMGGSNNSSNDNNPPNSNTSNTSGSSTSRSFSFSFPPSSSPTHRRSPSDLFRRSGSRSPTNVRRDSGSHSPTQSRLNNNGRRDSHDRHLPGGWDALD